MPIRIIEEIFDNALQRVHQFGIKLCEDSEKSTEIWICNFPRGEVIAIIDHQEREIFMCSSDEPEFKIWFAKLLELVKVNPQNFIEWLSSQLNI